MKKIFAIVFLLIIAVIFSSCQKTIVEKKSVKYVKAIRLQPTVFSEKRFFSGISKSEAESKFSFKLNGTIKRIYVKAGEKVKKGQLLAELDSDIYRLQKEQAQAGVERMQAIYDNVEKIYNRIKNLYENNAVPKNKFDEVSAKFAEAKAGLDAYNKKLHMAVLQLSYTRLYSTVNGYVAYKTMERGENIGAGMPLIIVNSSAETKVEFAVSENIVGKIHKNDEVKVRFDAFPNKVFNAKIDEISVSSIAALPSTFPVTAIIDDAKKIIRSDMTATVTVFLSKNKKLVIKIPSHTILKENNDFFVFVLKKASNDLYKVKKIKIELGELTNSGFVVKKGLKKGDLLVVAGLHSISNGLTVKLYKNSL